NGSYSGTVVIGDREEDERSGIFCDMEVDDAAERFLGILPGVRVDVLETPDSSKGSGPKRNYEETT
ncbi:MAG TPA: hypothetical protein VNX68_14350, partial [Nitrosopumilaceae archaeon]|nr:hypothetical protein [Nitrosopumilaceae archaeon]